MRASMSVLVLLILLGAAALLAGCRPVRPAPALEVTLSKAEDSAQVSWQGDSIVVDIASASGIGAAQLAWPGEVGPGDSLLLRLHLTGLEGLQVSNGLEQAALSVDSAAPYAVRAEGGAPALDVVRGDGVFLVRLEWNWLQNNKVDVRWVDFYR